jgi:hypothetical protein
MMTSDLRVRRTRVRAADLRPGDIVFDLPSGHETVQSLRTEDGMLVVDFDAYEAGFNPDSLVVILAS